MSKKMRLSIVALAMAAIVLPVAAMAADRFTDVPDSNVFHDDITWLADAGVTLGCNPPDNDEFCPSDSVTREQMAAFMRRLAENQVVDAGTLQGLTPDDLAGEGPRGPQGPQGPQGSRGPEGPAGPVAGASNGLGANCTLDGGTAYMNCGPPATVTLQGPGRIFVIATGSWESFGGSSAGFCRLTVDGTVVGPPDVSMGERADTTDSAAAHHFVLQTVTGELAPGDHALRIQCWEFTANMDWFDVVVSGIALGTG